MASDKSPAFPAQTLAGCGRDINKLFSTSVLWNKLVISTRKNKNKNGKQMKTRLWGQSRLPVGLCGLFWAMQKGRAWLSSCRTDGQKRFFPTEVPSTRDNLHVGAHGWKGAVDQRTRVVLYPMGTQAFTQPKTSMVAEFSSAHHGAELLQSRENW